MPQLPKLQTIFLSFYVTLGTTQYILTVIYILVCSIGLSRVFKTTFPDHKCVGRHQALHSNTALKLVIMLLQLQVFLSSFDSLFDCRHCHVILFRVLSFWLTLFCEEKDRCDCTQLLGYEMTLEWLYLAVFLDSARKEIKIVITYETSPYIFCVYKYKYLMECTCWYYYSFAEWSRVYYYCNCYYFTRSKWLFDLVRILAQRQWHACDSIYLKLCRK